MVDTEREGASGPVDAEIDFRDHLKTSRDFSRKGEL